MGANTSAVHSEGKPSGVSSVSNIVPSQRGSKIQSETKAASSLHSADQLVSSSSRFYLPLIEYVHLTIEWFYHVVERRRRN